MDEKEKLMGIRKALKEVIAYPPKGHPRRTKNGYPKEFMYDKFAYKRMIDSVRSALKAILKEYK
jgi:hypothetical protein